MWNIDEITSVGIHDFTCVLLDKEPYVSNDWSLF